MIDDNLRRLGEELLASYEEAYTENHKKGCLIAFDIKHGFINKIDEFEEVLVNYISLYGYGESACKELKESLY